jgi:hypothetical protein
MAIFLFVYKTLIKVKQKKFNFMKSEHIKKKNKKKYNETMNIENRKLENF